MRCKRKTFADVEKAARNDERNQTQQRLCRVIKWHFKNPELAEQLWAALNSGEQLRENGMPVRGVDIP